MWVLGKPRQHAVHAAATAHLSRPSGGQTKQSSSSQCGHLCGGLTGGLVPYGVWGPRGPGQGGDPDPQALPQVCPLPTHAYGTGMGLPMSRQRRCPDRSHCEYLGSQQWGQGGRAGRFGPAGLRTGTANTRREPRLAFVADSSHLRKTPRGPLGQFNKTVWLQAAVRGTMLCGHCLDTQSWLHTPSPAGSAGLSEQQQGARQACTARSPRQS